MGYKTILTVLTDFERQKQQLDSAIAMTRREDGHLDVFCMGVDHTQSGYYYAGASAYVLRNPSTRPWPRPASLRKRSATACMPRISAGRSIPPWRRSAGCQRWSECARAIPIWSC